MPPRVSSYYVPHVPFTPNTLTFSPCPSHTGAFSGNDCNVLLCLSKSSPPLKTHFCCHLLPEAFPDTPAHQTCPARGLHSRWALSATLRILKLCNYPSAMACLPLRVVGTGRTGVPLPFPAPQPLQRRGLKWSRLLGSPSALQSSLVRTHTLMLQVGKLRVRDLEARTTWLVRGQDG